MDLEKVRERRRKVAGLSGIVSVDGGLEPDPEPGPANRDRASRDVECGPLLKLPKRYLVPERKAEAPESKAEALTGQEHEAPEKVIQTVMEATACAPSSTTTHAEPDSTDTSIESFVALFREITDFADTVYPGARADDCQITVLVGQKKLEFHVVGVEPKDP